MASFLILTTLFLPIFSIVPTFTESQLTTIDIGNLNKVFYLIPYGFSGEEYLACGEQEINRQDRPCTHVKTSYHADGQSFNTYLDAIDTDFPLQLVASVYTSPTIQKIFMIYEGDGPEFYIFTNNAGVLSYDSDGSYFSINSLDYSNVILLIKNNDTGDISNHLFMVDYDVNTAIKFYKIDITSNTHQEFVNINSLYLNWHAGSASTVLVGIEKGTSSILYIDYTVITSDESNKILDNTVSNWCSELSGISFSFDDSYIFYGAYVTADNIEFQGIVKLLRYSDRTVLSQINFPDIAGRIKKHITQLRTFPSTIFLFIGIVSDPDVSPFGFI